MLVSVEIVSGCKLLKLGCSSSIGNSDSGRYLLWHRCWYFQMPPELQDQPFVCSIGKSQNGSFQDCPCSVIARDAIEFAGKFTRYRVEPSDAHPATFTTATRGSPDVFSVLMSSQREIQFVKCVSSPRNKKEESANAVSSWLENKGVGFQPTDVETKGKCLLSTLADALWVIDGHVETLADRSYAIPTEFACFSGYNVPHYVCDLYSLCVLLYCSHVLEYWCS